MTSKSSFYLALLLASALFSTPASAKDDSAIVERLAKAYVAAQFNFDPEEIKRLTTGNFVEISPKGEVDERDAVISFYMPSKRTEVPPYDISDSKVRISGKTAVVSQILTIGQAPNSMQLSQLITATQLENKWLLTSSQSTPIPKKAPGKQ